MGRASGRVSVLAAGWAADTTILADCDRRHRPRGKAPARRGPLTAGCSLPGGLRFVLVGAVRGGDHAGLVGGHALALRAINLVDDGVDGLPVGVVLVVLGRLV